MQEAMGGEDLRKALIALGERLRARSELPRLRRIDQPRAARLEGFLDQYHDDGP